MSRLIAAIDQSAAAQPVLAFSAALAPIFRASVEAVHVSTNGDGDTVSATAEALAVPLHTTHGDPANRLERIAEEPDVVAVVLGIRGRPAGRRPAGHVALDLITRLDKPVVVVPPDAKPVESLRRVLVPLDASTATGRGLEEALEIARAGDLDITIVHVADEASLPSFSDQLQHETDAWTEEFLCRYCPASARTGRIELRVGVPAEQVLRVASESDAELVIVSWSRRLAGGHAAVVRHLLEHSTIPILLLPLHDADVRRESEAAIEQKTEKITLAGNGAVDR